MQAEEGLLGHVACQIRVCNSTLVKCQQVLLLCQQGREVDSRLLLLLWKLGAR